ncbi:MAG: hypothetical protein ABSE75_06015 [Acidimicrobiales bacterium]
MSPDLPASHVSTSPVNVECANRFAIFDECPLCGSTLTPEHAHFRCSSCGWRDSCCD